MRKFFLSILICLCSIFLMSHNAFAADIVNDDVYLYSTQRYITFSCNTDGGFNNYVNNTTSCHLGSRAQVNTITFFPTNPFTFPQSYDFFFEVYLRISNNANTDNTVWYGATNGTNMQFVSEEQVSSTTSGSITYRTYRLLYKYTGSASQFNYSSPVSISSNGGMFAGESFKIQGVIIWQTAGSDTASIVNAINAQNQYLSDISQNLYIADGHLSDISDYLDFIKDEIPSSQDIANDIADEEEDRVQDSSDQAQQDADQAQQDANQATSSLLGVGSSIVSTIVNQPATNCLIDMTFAHYTVGNVNLCDKVPTAILNLIQGLASLVIVPIIAMYALYLLNKLIGILRGFTG